MSAKEILDSALLKKKQIIQIFIISFFIVIAIGIIKSIGIINEGYFSVFRLMIKHVCFGVITGMIVCIALLWIEPVFDNASDRLYLFALLLILAKSFLIDTLFLFPDWGHMLLLFVSYAVLLVKVVRYDQPSIRKIVLFLILIICALMAYYYSRDTVNEHIINLIVFMFAVHNISFDKIIKIYIAVGTSILILSFVASTNLFQLIPNLNFPHPGRPIRYAFGLCYCTHWGDHVLYLILSVFYLNRNKIKVREYVLCAFILFFLIKYNQSQQPLICIVLFIAGSLAIITFQRLCKSDAVRNVITNAFGFLAVISVPLSAVAITALSYYYNPDLIEGMIPDRLVTLTSRLVLQHNALTTYDICLIGRGIDSNIRYYCDSAFLNCLFYEGLILTLTFIVFLVIIAYRNRKDMMFSLIIMILAINGFMAERLFLIHFNPFMLMLFAMQPAEKYNDLVHGRHV